MDGKLWWLVGGLIGGYVLSRHVGIGGGFSVSARANVGGKRVAGSGAVPLDQPTGTVPYQQVGAYNPYFSAGFPDLPDPGANARIIETDVNGQGYIQ